MPGEVAGPPKRTIYMTGLVSISSQEGSWTETCETAEGAAALTSAVLDEDTVAISTHATTERISRRERFMVRPLIVYSSNLRHGDLSLLTIGQAGKWSAKVQ